jgi:hypothetical protein
LGANGYLLEAGASDTASARFLIRFSSDNTLLITRGQNADRITSQVFRDVSAWGHLVVTVDTTQATANDRIKVYINGAQVTAFSSTSNPAQNDDLGVNAAAVHAIGRSNIDSGDYFNGYLADIYFIDGQALTPSSFTETDATTGQLIPKAFSGSYGSQGWHLEFADNSSNTATTLGKDTSGNGNNWTPNNLSVTAGAGNDSLVDVPTNGAQTDTGVGGEVRGNYATLNPLSKQANCTLSNGNLDWTATSTGSVIAQSTIAISSGKWYCEFTATSASNMFGLQRAAGTVATTFIGGNADSWGYYADNGNKYTNNSATSYGASYTTNDVIGVAFDADAGTLTFYKNGASQGQAYSGLTNGPYTFATGNGGSTSAVFNAGARPFAYTAPSGFKALCTANLPAPLVTKPNTVMDVALYTGNGSARSITGLGFNPDLVWIKSRSAATDHELTDSVRGTTKSLSSNLTAAEATDTGGLTAFNSDGFSLGTDTKYNNNAATYVAWCWDAGSSTDTNNTAGTITPTGVRANATAGFSIVTYTGTGANATVGHGLGVAPQMIIVKTRSAGNSWKIYHSGLTSAAYNLEFTTGAQLNEPQSWNSTAPTSTVFSVGTQNSTNQSGATQVAYCFAPVVGYSSFGSYTGNGSTDGPFIYTGFRPRWVLIKASSTTGEWGICDSARDTYNVVSNVLLAESSGSDNPGLTLMDFTSNGFKLRNTNAVRNGSGQTYIYAAFAESPFNYARAR